MRGVSSLSGRSRRDGPRHATPTTSNAHRSRPEQSPGCRCGDTSGRGGNRRGPLCRRSWRWACRWRFRCPWATVPRGERQAIPAVDGCFDAQDHRTLAPLPESPAERTDSTGLVPARPGQDTSPSDRGVDRFGRPAAGPRPPYASLCRDPADWAVLRMLPRVGTRRAGRALREVSTPPPRRRRPARCARPGGPAALRPPRSGGRERRRPPRAARRAH